MGNRVKIEKQQDISFKPNDCIKIEIDIISGAQQNEEAPTYSEVPVIYRYPIIRTTRLDNMCVIQKNLKRMKRKNIIQKIALESRNIFKNNVQDYNRRCTCRNNKHRTSFKKLQKKLSILSTNTEVLNIESGDDNITDVSSDEEIFAQMIKRKKEETLAKVPIKKKKSDPNALKLLVNYLQRRVDLEVIDVMGISDFNVIIIISNLYSQSTEVYVTDIKNTIIEFVTVPYEDYSILYNLFHFTNKEERTLSYHLLQVNCCCWIRRHKEIISRFPKKFVNFLTTAHGCSPECSCCCKKKIKRDALEEHTSEINKTNAIFKSLFADKRLQISKKNCLQRTALGFHKPMLSQLHTHNTFKTQPIKRTAIEWLPIHIKYTNSSKKSENTVFIEDYELTNVGTENHIVLHGLRVGSLSKIDTIDIRFKDLCINACCNYSFHCIFNEAIKTYYLNPNILKFMDGIHNCNNFKSLMVEKCIKCKYKYPVPLIKLAANYKIINVENMEHVRKAIVGQIVTPKVHILAQTKNMEEKTKTIQEIMAKLEGKFANISFFLNEAGLLVASLPKPYHCYPLEDLGILVQVLEFAQRKINGQQEPEVSTTDITRAEPPYLPPVPVYPPIAPTIPIVSMELPSYTINDSYGENSASTHENFDFCSILIKCNKTSYIKSFESYINNSETNKCVEEICMPTITNVCSLNEDDEMARQLFDPAVVTSAHKDLMEIKILDDN